MENRLPLKYRLAHVHQCMVKHALHKTRRVDQPLLRLKDLKNVATPHLKAARHHLSSQLVQLPIQVFLKTPHLPLASFPPRRLAKRPQ